MYEFTSNDWFHVKGCGDVVCVNEELPKGLWHPNQLVNTEVAIDGEVYVVKSAEVHPIGGVSPSNPYKLRFGLLIERTPV